MNNARNSKSNQKSRNRIATSLATFAVVAAGLGVTGDPAMAEVPSEPTNVRPVQLAPRLRHQASAGLGDVDRCWLARVERFIQDPDYRTSGLPRGGRQRDDQQSDLVTNHPDRIRRYRAVDDTRAADRQPGGSSDGIERWWKATAARAMIDGKDRSGVDAEVVMDRIRHQPATSVDVESTELLRSQPGDQIRNLRRDRHADHDCQ